MGNRSFVVELKKEADIKKISYWLEGAGDETTDFAPYSCGMVTLGKRQFALLGCDGNYGLRMFCAVGFNPARIFHLDDPDFYNYLYEKMIKEGTRYKKISWRNG